MTDRIEKLIQSIREELIDYVQEEYRFSDQYYSGHAKKMPALNFVEDDMRVLRELHEHAQKMRGVICMLQTKVTMLGGVEYALDANNVLAAYDAWIKGE